MIVMACERRGGQHKGIVKVARLQTCCLASALEVCFLVHSCGTPEALGCSQNLVTCEACALSETCGSGFEKWKDNCKGNSLNLVCAGSCDRQNHSFSILFRPFSLITSTRCNACPPTHWAQKVRRSPTVWSLKAKSSTKQHQTAVLIELLGLPGPVVEADLNLRLGFGGIHLGSKAQTPLKRPF